MDNARVQETKDGLFFYEQDIIMSKYQFNRDLQIDLVLKYEHPGFGIVFATDDEQGPMTANHRYLFHQGDNSFEVIERHMLTQGTGSVRANVLSPGPDVEVHLRFTYKNRKIRLYWVKTLEDKTEDILQLGNYYMTRKLPTYYVGFYSQAGNTIKDISFLQGEPDRWFHSIANVHGGRISFWDNGFKFEDCIHDAELEQRNILLKPGDYWFFYDKEPVNGIYDIEGFVYPTDISEAPPDNDASLKDKAAFDERWLEDKGKSLLDENNHFCLETDTSVLVSFKGMNGKVSNIFLTDTRQGSFVATRDEAVIQDGSYIEIDLTGLTAVSWEGRIFEVPEYTDLSKPRPYGLMVTETDRIPMIAVGVTLEEMYTYYYDVATSVLEVMLRTYDYSDTETDIIDRYRGSYHVTLKEEDNNKVKIFKNIRANMFNLTLYFEDGSSVNINHLTTYKVLLPDSILGPIIVTDKDNKSFDLSSSFREVVKDNQWQIDYFSTSALELKLRYRTAKALHNAGEFQVFGIPEGIDIHKGAVTIKDFADSYVEITDYEFDGNIVTILPEIRDDYAFIAVRYKKGEDYNYWFTVYEREVFDGTEDYLRLAKTVNESGKEVRIFGITGDYDERYLYRVPGTDTTLATSIDFCAEVWSLISSQLYTVDVEDNAVILSSQLAGKYDYYIVDYMKQNSYAINWIEVEGTQGRKTGKFLVEIASDEPVMLVHYEMDNDGISSTVIRTEIKADENKFIILKRQRGAFTDEV